MTKPELLNMTESLFEASSLKQQQELVEYLKKKKKSHLVITSREKKQFQECAAEPKCARGKKEM